MNFGRTGRGNYSLWVILLTVGIMVLSACAGGDSTAPVPDAAGGPGPIPAGNGPSPDKVPVKLVACYFHGTVRCFSCLEIEREARQMVYQTMLEPLSQGILEWRSINYDSDLGAPLAKPFGLSIPALVLIHEGADGAVLGSKNLEQMWDLVGDPEKLREYVQGEILTMLGPVRLPAALGH